MKTQPFFLMNTTQPYWANKMIFFQLESVWLLEQRSPIEFFAPKQTRFLEFSIG